jgi:hypothetical protein
MTLFKNYFLSTSRYYKYKEKTLLNWTSSRPTIYEDFLAGQVPSKKRGDKCEGCSEEKDIWCVCADCGPLYIECVDCSNAAHRIRPLHFRRLWSVSMHFFIYLTDESELLSIEDLLIICNLK